MANINLSRAYEKVCFEGFGGIDRARSGEGGISDLKNLRLEADGRLSKRCGFAPICELPEGKLRAIHAVSDTLVFALVGSGLYKLDPSLASCTLVATLDESDSDACFFYYENALHLIDGTELYVYDGTEFKPAEGYVPLYGKEWSPSGFGEVYQPLNAFSSRIRVSFKVGKTSPPRLVLPYVITSIDRVYLNGVIQPLNLFTVDETIALNLNLSETYSEGDVIEVFYTPDTVLLTRAREKAAANTRAETFGVGTSGGDTSSLVLYGGTDPSLIYLSRHVDADDMAKVKSRYTDASPLYVVTGDAITADLGKKGITAACRSGSHLAIFSESSAYLMSESSGALPRLTPISHSSGCSVKDGAVTLDNSPVTISDGQILIWTPSTLHDDEYIAKCISSPIAELMVSRENVGAVAYHKRKNELWFYISGEERVWIYNVELKCWYSFDGFSPDLLLTIGGKMAFVSGSALYAFSDELFYDENADGWHPIRAVIESNVMSFGAPNRKKRLARAMVSFLSEGNLHLTITDAESTSVGVDVKVTGNETIDYYETRLPCKRSRYYSFTLTHEDGPFTIYAIAFSAVK